MTREESEGGPRPWFERAFRARYLHVYAHRTPEAARAEVRGLVERGLAGRTLDLGCGFGRHVVALREAGLAAFGLDLSAELLLHARRRPDAVATRGRLVRADARAVPFAAGSFDAVVSLFSSFGYFDDVGNARAAREIARVLRDGGRAVLDLMNPARVRSTLVPESERVEEGVRVHETRRLSDGGRRVVKEVELRLPDGREERWREDVRLYEPDELEHLCEPWGLRVVRIEGDFDGRPLHPDAPRQIAWLRRELALPGGPEPARKLS